MLHKAPVRRSNVTVDDRRAVFTIARNRKPTDVAKVKHEDFIRNALKDRLGWPRREPAPDGLKAAAREMAAQLVARDKASAEAARAAAREKQEQVATQ